jgi:hypothetical protein
MSLKKHPFWHYVLVVLVVVGKGLVSELLWFLVGLGGYFIFISKRSPYNIVLGLPLLLVGGGFVINSLWSEILSVFSPAYNRGICFLCNGRESE